MMNVTMVNVYAVVMDPPEKDGVYLSRFLEDVFEKKSIALASLRDAAREFAGELRCKCAGCSRVEIEFDRDASKVVIYNESCEQDTPKVVQLRIEKIAVPKGRIEFVDGKAKVKNWGEALNKDRRFIDWDAGKWAMSFNEAHWEGGEYSVDELRACCDWWKFIGVAEQELPMPELVTGCPWFMDQPECAQIHVRVDDWQVLLAVHPEFADRCTVWDRFTGGHWSCLLSRRPEFADRCKWDKLSGEDWANILVERPEFSSHCQWNKLEGRNWVQLLKCHPEFANHCNWECLRGRDWCELLTNVPELEKNLVVTRLKDGTARGCGWLAGFLEKFPQHIPDCDLRELGDGWPRFLVTYPQYADQCDFSKFDADGWGVLLPHRPEFVNKVDWSIDWRKKYYGGYVLMDLLEKVPYVREKCDWRKLKVDVRVEVLEKYPEIAEKCDLGDLALTRKP
jgi:hypothetical protein